MASQINEIMKFATELGELRAQVASFERRLQRLEDGGGIGAVSGPADIAKFAALLKRLDKGELELGELVAELAGGGL